MSDVLELASVSVVRGKKTLLDKVDWQVNEGERWVILGPNGAGKTTLLQIAAARLHPSSGKAGILDETLGRSLGAQVASVGLGTAAGVAAFVGLARRLRVRELQALLSLRRRSATTDTE